MNQLNDFINRAIFTKITTDFGVYKIRSQLLTNRVKNRKKTAKYISIFDFSTLYAKLPYNDLLKVLHKLIDFVFDGGRNSEMGNRKYLSLFN